MPNMQQAITQPIFPMWCASTRLQWVIHSTQDVYFALSAVDIVDESHM